MKRDQKARGRFLGGTRPPFGYRGCESGELMPDDAEQAAIAKAKRLHGRGKSLRYIAGELALDGHRLNPESVRRRLPRAIGPKVEAADVAARASAKSIRKIAGALSVGIGAVQRIVAAD